MQYSSAFFSTLYVLINDLLQIAGANDTTHITSKESGARLEINPQFISDIGHNLIVRKKNESLNLTCTVEYKHNIINDSLSNYTLDWEIPFHVITSQKFVKGRARNVAWLWFDKLTENHSGNYTCKDMSSSGHGQHLFINIYLSVKNKLLYCGPQWFKCRSKHCIMERYMCDGKDDCGEGEDESVEAGCGPDPCYGKVLCIDRCIPPEWCCDHKNCNSTFGFRPWQSDTNEINYMQTALYHTVVGWAMAFMFMVTILLIAICRVHIKKAMYLRWQQQNHDTCQAQQILPHGMNIMYNVDNVVEFIDQPLGNPPPYSEVLCAPSLEGPPPAYESCEHYTDQPTNTRIISECVTDSPNDNPPPLSFTYDTSSCDKSIINLSNISQGIERH